jgi:hypothetical protein
MGVRTGGRVSSDLKKNNAQAKARAMGKNKGGGGGAQQAEDWGLVDTQQSHGNDFLKEMVKGEQKEANTATAPAMKKEGPAPEKGATAQKANSKAGGLAGMQLPSDVRARLLSSNDMVSLASLVYSQCSPASEVTKEMLAIASVHWNRYWHTKSNAADQKEFGRPNFEEMAIPLFQAQPFHFQPQGYRGFQDAAKFNGGFQSQQEVDTAIAAIRAADQIMNSGNPFPHEFMYLGVDPKSPVPERTDARTHMKFGKLHFWAFSEEGKVAGQKQSDQGQQESNSLQAAVMTGADAAPPPV